MTQKRPAANPLADIWGSDNILNLMFVVIICDTVFRALSATQLVGYFSTIGFFYGTVKATSYLLGIAGNVGMLTRQRWGAPLAIAAAAIGLWLTAIDLWSLFHAAFGPGLVRFNNFFLVRNSIQQIGRGAWLGSYIVAILIVTSRMPRR